ncbi:hypothetical protein H4Q26_012368 [Puccinia striiformis f. sp. tritici PST-130]|nr:hypothetical protein H4Q26_012368 [Puccinia striiformis f. sp. tritici PST-130]
MAQLINVRSRSLGFGLISFGLAIWATNPSNLSGQLREESQLVGGHEFAIDDPGAVALSHNEATDINSPQHWLWERTAKPRTMVVGRTAKPNASAKTPSGKHRDVASPMLPAIRLHPLEAEPYPPSNAQGHELVVSQLSVREPSRIQLSNSIDRGAPAIGLRGFTDLTNLIQQHRPSASHRSYLHQRENLRFPLFLTNKKKFEPICMQLEILVEGITWLKRSTPAFQIQPSIFSRIAQLFALQKFDRFNAQALRRRVGLLKISTTTQELHQQEMLNWLDREFFLPIDSLPVTGPIIPQFPAWKAGMPEETLGRNQVMLIKYFSRQERDLELLPATASELVADFFKRHGTEYHSPGLPPKPSSDDPIPLEIYDLVRERLSNDQTLQMITGLLATFQNQCDRTSTKHHLKLLNIEVKNIETRRKTLLEWLIQSTVKPNGSLPVHGLVLIKDKRSPWDQLPDEDSMKLFGPVQQELIEYFSKNDKKIPSMKRKLAFLTAAWYQHYHAEELGCLAENVRKQVIPR